MRIHNFRAIEKFEVDDLADFIVIAGPNGCGKSCVLDAIRLLKSVYGGYQTNELMQWFGEFQINLHNPADIRRLFRDPSTPIEIQSRFELSMEEIEYLRTNAESVLEPIVWARVTGRDLESFGYSVASLAMQFREYQTTVDEKLAAEAEALRLTLSASTFDLAVHIDLKGRITSDPSPTMEAVFQTYDPENLGIVDYHSASRAYEREQVGGVDLSLTGLQNQRRSYSLYNWQAKYSNVKSELATTYIQEMIAERAGGGAPQTDLNETLAELFQTFFPDKTYLGVQPNTSGELSFPIELKSGQVHDINELSSGEKEVVYGYLRLRNSTPLRSTILLDEPELHLNPGLLQGFPDFYHRHLGVALGNQLWLVTHSDTLLRQAVGNHNFSVFHMTSAATESVVENQAMLVVAEDELERATIDLVGDLATYRPRGKVILFEGGGNTEVDRWLTMRLFPEIARRVNLVSGGGKRRVHDLYEVLSATAEGVGMADRFFVITDKDTAEYKSPPTGTHVFNWDVYHIENYLLEAKFILGAMGAVMQSASLSSVEEVDDALHAAAHSVRQTLLVQRLRKHINDTIVGAVNIGGDPELDPVDGIKPSVEGTFDRLKDLQPELGDDAKLRSIAAGYEADLDAWLRSDAWRKEFPGRSILRAFVNDHVGGVANYDAFRNLIVTQMVEAGFEPAGMHSILNQIVET